VKTLVREQGVPYFAAQLRCSGRDFGDLVPAYVNNPGQGTGTDTERPRHPVSSISGNSIRPSLFRVRLDNFQRQQQLLGTAGQVGRHRHQQPLALTVLELPESPVLARRHRHLEPALL
jgi:hypothetical protein